MIFRRYRAEDFAGLCAIEERCYAPQLRVSPQYLQQLIKRDDTATWVAEDCNVILGFAIVEWTKESASNGSYLQIMEVAPELRGRGIDTRLMSLAEASASSAKSQAILLHVDAEDKAAIRLYEGCGYRRRGGKRHRMRGREAYLYMKELVAPPTSLWSRIPKASKTLLPLLANNI